MNNNHYDTDRKVSVWELGVHKNTTFTQVMMTFESGFTTDPVEVPVEKGCINVHMPAFSAMVICGYDKLTCENLDSPFALGVPDIDIPEDALGMRFLSGKEVRDKSFTDMKIRERKKKKEKEFKQIKEKILKAEGVKKETGDDA